jgi:hypothetical protein
MMRDVYYSLKYCLWQGNPVRLMLIYWWQYSVALVLWPKRLLELRRVGVIQASKTPRRKTPRTHLDVKV